MHFLRKHSAYIPALLMDFCISSILTNAAFYSSHLHLSSTFLGTILAISTAFFVILAIPFGRLSDRVDRTHILAAACLLLAGVGLIFRFCRSQLHLAFAFPCVGVSLALFWPAYEAWLAEREGGGRLIRRVMIFNLFWSAGIMFGPFISGYLYRDSTPFVPFYLASGFSLFNWFTIHIQGKLSRSGVQPQSDMEHGQTFELNLSSTEPPSTLKHTCLRIARIANFASWFSLGILRGIAPKLTLEMGIATKTFGNLMLTLGGVQTLMFLWLGTDYSTRWHYRLAPLIGVQFSAMIGCLGIWLLPQAIFWMPALALIGVCTAVTYFSSIYYSLHEQRDKGNKSGWHEAVLGSGLLLGPFLGGAFADSALGVKSPYLLCAGVIGICILVEGFIWLRTCKEKGESSAST